MIQIEIIREEQFEFGEDEIRNEVSRVVIEKGYGDSPTEVVISVVGDLTMRELHEKYMETDEVTDVLSFPLNDNPNNQVEPGPDGVVRLGDIVICYNVAVKQAEEAGRTTEKEMAFLAGHGCRHLLGEHHD